MFFRKKMDKRNTSRIGRTKQREKEREGGRKTEKVWVIPTKRQSANVPGYVQNDTTCTRAHTTGFAWRTERDGTREREREGEAEIRTALRPHHSHGYVNVRATNVVHT